MGTRIVVMKDGVVQQVDTPQNIYNFPSNIFVAGFMGSPQMNFFDGQVVEENDKLYATIESQRILLPEETTKVLKKENLQGKDVTFGIRPENIELDNEYESSTNHEAINARVEVVELMGAESYIHTKADNQNLTIRVNGTTDYKVGQLAKIYVDTSKIHVFNKETEMRVI